MVWRPTGLWALAILVFVFAAQVHVWVDSGPAQTSGHLCQFCVAGAWAIVAVTPGLEVAMRALPLESQPSQMTAKYDRTDRSAPRAPPQA